MRTVRLACSPSLINCSYPPQARPEPRCRTWQTAFVTNNPWNPADYDERFSFVTELGEELISQVDPQPGQRILDVGCGTGHLTAQMSKSGAKTLGVDSDPNMIATAQREYPADEWLVADFQELNLPEVPTDTFDAALSNAALHWMPQQATALRNVRVALRGGAVFVAEMGGSGNIATVDSAIRESLIACGLTGELPNSFFPTVAEESQLLEQASFRVDEMRWFPRPTPLNQGETVADWVANFRAAMWNEIPASSREPMRAEIESRAAQAGLFRDGIWFIDYCRLRFRATAI